MASEEGVYALRSAAGLYILPSEEGTSSRGAGTFVIKPTPESGLECLACAIFARGEQRTPSAKPGAPTAAERREKSSKEFKDFDL